MTLSSVAKNKPVPKGRTDFESIALLLQGGGALGAYQAGVYEALAKADIAPDWVGGISMGAINGAIIAGNKPGARLGKLQDFWESLTTSDRFWRQFSSFSPFIKQGGEALRTFWNMVSAGTTLIEGVPGFFEPRLLPPWMSPPGSPGALSFYDTGSLRVMLESFVDFGILNAGAVRYTTSAVNLRTGNYTVFDNRTREIIPEHIMASAALPPGLPPVEIEGDYYWDGGLISNTPLRWVMDDAANDTLVFQVDLWSSRGELPKDMLETMTREKEIQYSSRTRAMTDQFKAAQKWHHAFAKLYKKLPENLKKTEEAKLLYTACDDNVYNIVHLIYRARHYEGYSKDYEFSRLSMEEHWKAGYNDTVRSLRHKDILKRPDCREGIKTYDVAED
jgi:NTE family protein